MARDRDLLFGTLALQVGLIDEAQFLDACRAWLSKRDASLVDVLTASGKLGTADASAVARLIESRAEDAQAPTPEEEVRRTLDALAEFPFDPFETSWPDDDAPLPGGGVRVTWDRYALTRLHAEGGLGRVWLARDESLGREVALKELRPDRAGHPGIGARFLEEARVTGQLEHPNIVPVYELSGGGPGSPPFYAMRFVKGKTLAEAIRDYHRDAAEGRAGLLEFRGLLNALVAVGNAVAFAHARGVLHRDLKPQNVILGDYGEVVVLDWGLAKRLGEAETAEDGAPAPVDPAGTSATLDGQAMGTPAYMPPEQAAGRSAAVDRRSDVYGLGATLYQILTGRPPFLDSDTESLLRRVREEPPLMPRWVRPSADPALEAVCLKALSKKPGDRYPTAPEFSAEIQRWLAGEPVDAYPEPPPARVRRWVSHHRTAVTAGAAAASVGVIALVVATVLLAYGRDRERAARELAEKHKLEAVAQEAQANKNFATAREAVERYLMIITESELLTRPGLQPLRERLLREGMKYYSKFTAEHAADPKFQADLASAHLRLGRITEEIGPRTEALEHYRRARELLARLARSRPDDPDRLGPLADCQNRLGNLEAALGMTDDALASLQSARALAARLTARDPADPRPRNYLAGIENNLGNVQQAAGLTAEALASYRRARGEFGLLALETPEADEAVTGHRAGVAGTDQNIGVLLRESGRLEEALAALERARDLRRELASSGRAGDRLRREHARGLNQLGLTQRELGLADPARDSHAEAAAIQEALADANPAVTDHQRDLANSLVNLGDIAAAGGRPEEALASFQRARGLLESLEASNPGETDYRESLAAVDLNSGIVLQDLGRQDEARLAFERARGSLAKIVQGAPDDRDARAQLALVWNNLGGLARALGRPGEALAWHRKARDAFEQLASDPKDAGTYRADLANTDNFLGVALQDLGRRPDALRVHTRAMEQFDRLLDETPDSAGLKRDLAITLLSVAHIQRQARKPAEAMAAASRARDLFEDLHRTAPGVTQGRRDLVSSLDLLGTLAREAGRRGEARDTLARARDTQETAMRTGVPGPDDHSLLGSVLAHLSLADLDAGEADAALKAAEGAVSQQEAARDARPAAAEYRALLSNHLGQLSRLQRRLGRPDDADATALRRLSLASESPIDPDGLVDSAADLAVGLLLPSGKNPTAATTPWPREDPVAERRVADAWEALKRAVAAGFDDFPSLRADPDLAGLLAVAEVATWLQRAESTVRVPMNAARVPAGTDQPGQEPTTCSDPTGGAANSGDASGRNVTRLERASPPCPIVKERIGPGPAETSASSSSSRGQNGILVCNTTRPEPRKKSK